MELLLKKKDKKTISTESFIKLMFFVLITFIFWLKIFLDGYSNSLNKCIGIWTLFLSVYLLYAYRKNIGLFVVMFFIAYTNYSVVVGVYFFPELHFNYYSQISNIKTYGIGLTSIMFFEFFLACFSLFAVKKGVNNCTDNINHCVGAKTKKSNYWVSYGAMIIYLFAFFYGIVIGRQIEDRLANSPLKEYRTIFLIISVIYSNRNKLIRNCWIVIIAITSLLVFFGGSRADAFPSLFVFAIYYCPKWLKARHILLIMIPMIIFFAAIGYFRTDFSISLDIFSYTIEKLNSDKLTYEGAIAGYFPSIAMIEISDVLSIEEKIYLFVKHIVYIFGGSGIGNPDLSEFSRDYYGHYYGFITPSYCYVWFGTFLGALLIALLVQFYIHIVLKTQIQKEGSKKNNQYFKGLCLYFISTVSRWYCYGPMGLLRGVFVFTCIYLIVYIFYKSIFYKKVVKLENN